MKSPGTMPIHLAIVVPCFNEEAALPETNRRLLSLLTDLTSKQLISSSSCVHYVDDGSSDGTWALVESLAVADGRVHGIKLSRNRGHQFAVLAGLLTVEGDAVVSVDADLQDDVSVIESMVTEFNGGAEVVYGVRRSRQTDSAFKRNTARMYYGLMRRMGVDLVHDHADFRLLGRRAIDALPTVRRGQPVPARHRPPDRVPRGEGQLRSRTANCGRVEVPATPDAQLWAGRNDVFQHRAAADDHAARLRGFGVQLRDDRTCRLRRPGTQGSGAWLGVVGRSGLFPRRHPACFRSGSSANTSRRSIWKRSDARDISSIALFEGLLQPQPSPSPAICGAPAKDKDPQRAKRLQLLVLAPDRRESRVFQIEGKVVELAAIHSEADVERSSRTIAGRLSSNSAMIIRLCSSAACSTRLTSAGSLSSSRRT